jgi:hypothetical protein
MSGIVPVGALFRYGNVFSALRIKNRKTGLRRRVLGVKLDALRVFSLEASYASVRSGSINGLGG